MEHNSISPDFVMNFLLILILLKKNCKLLLVSKTLSIAYICIIITLHIYFAKLNVCNLLITWIIVDLYFKETNDLIFMKNILVKTDILVDNALISIKGKVKIANNISVVIFKVNSYKEITVKGIKNISNKGKQSFLSTKDFIIRNKKPILIELTSAIIALGYTIKKFYFTKDEKED